MYNVYGQYAAEWISVSISITSQNSRHLNIFCQSQFSNKLDRPSWLKGYTISELTSEHLQNLDIKLEHQKREV